MQMTTKLRSIRPSWPAILLFTALLAQAPHAAAVFIRIAPHDAQWEIATSFIGAWVYAIALEGATAYFVWRNKLSWAIAFAVFSVAHNIAYYMPSAWTVDVWGATLTVSYIFSAILISMSLPIAIAAFSHVQSTSTDTHQTPATTPVAVPGVTTGHSETSTEGTNEREKSPGRRSSIQAADRTLATDSGLASGIGSQDVSAVPPQSAPQVPGRKVRKAKRKTAKPTPAQRQAQIVGAGIDDAAQIVAQFGVSLRTAQADLESIRKSTMQTNGASHP